MVIGLPLRAQVIEETAIPTDTTKSERIQAFSESAWFETNDTSNTQYLIGNVKIYHDSTYMFCDSAIINGQKLKAIGNVIVLQPDSLKIFADTLYYDGDSLRSELLQNVILENDKNKMYSNHLYYNMSSKIATFYDTASFFLERTKIKSVKGIYDTKIDKATFIEKVNMIDSTFTLRTDTLDFYTKQERMIFRAPTRMEQGTKQIYCEAGYYDVRNNISSFEKNAQYKDIETIATSHKILYYDKNQEIQLIGNAYFKDNEQRATADKIIYNKENKTFDLYGNAHYKNSEKQINGETIHYDETSKSMKTTGRSIIDDDEMHLEANDIDFDETRGIGVAIGNVIYRDKIANMNVYGERMDIYDNNNQVKVYSPSKPSLLESIMDNDTMFLSADTLHTHSIIDSLGKEHKRIDAYNNVKIYKSDLQAVADSMNYNTETETIRLFINPTMWSDTSQFTGDTIELKLKNKKVNRVILFPKGFITQTQDEEYFSQISGRKIIISFNDSTISKMDVIGNAESIYYMTDELKKYTGVSKTICTKIQFTFRDGELSKSRFSPKSNTEILPMESTNHNQIKLNGFSWQTDRRPMSLMDILAVDIDKKEIETTKEDDIRTPKKVKSDIIRD